MVTYLLWMFEMLIHFKASGLLCVCSVAFQVKLDSLNLLQMSAHYNNIKQQNSKKKSKVKKVFLYVSLNLFSSLLCPDWARQNTHLSQLRLT